MVSFIEYYTKTTYLKDLTTFKKLSNLGEDLTTEDLTTEDLTTFKKLSNLGGRFDNFQKVVNSKSPHK